MTDFFQIISAKITTFITVVIIAVTSILPWSATNTNKPLGISTASPSATISESPLPSASITPTLAPKVKTKVEITPTPAPTPFPTLVPQITTNSSPTSNTQPKTYSIVPISVMSIGSMAPDLQIIAQNAYQEFLRTSNLNRLDESNQMEILVGIYARMLREEIAAAQQNLSQLKQENASTPTPTPVAIYINSEIETKLAELRQTLENIQNQPVAMNIIEGRIQRAYQDWIKNNPAIYSAILGSRYINDLNAIIRAYGL